MAAQNCGFAASTPVPRKMSWVMGLLVQLIDLPPSTGVNVRAPFTTLPIHLPLGVFFSSAYVFHTSSIYLSKYLPLGPSLAKPARQGERSQKSPLTQALNSFGASLRKASKSFRRDSMMPTFLLPSLMVMGMQKASTCVVLPCQVPLS